MRARKEPPITDVAAIYFPSWHADPRRDAYLGAGWTEWELVRAGRPRFPGHYQPIEPSWGYPDETDPAVMRRSLQTAAEHGVDAFLWDWYVYDGEDFLNRPLNETYLGLDAPASSSPPSNAGDRRENDQGSYADLAARADFAELKRRYRMFAFPATIAFMVWYVTYVVCNNWARGFLDTQVVGNVNVALVFGLLQFVSTFAIAFCHDP